MHTIKFIYRFLILTLILAACAQVERRAPIQERPTSQVATQPAAQPAAEASPAVGESSATQHQSELARQALLDYFTTLNQGDYLQAVELYGGGYELLQDYNPEVPPQEHAQLLQAACRFNGFMCFLPVRQIVTQEQVAANEFHFAVEFQNADGTLFELGPCCGAGVNSQPPVSQFDYTVVFQEGRYRVMELPVYVP
jgi:hypothetical protein